MTRYILFDLDDTLYPTSAGLMHEISARMSEFMVARVGIPASEVDRVRRDYWARYGTTLRGLYIER
ncbi:MAG: pyrimidine 5'-nucleotidase, partial [Chloroflexota bacterium]|nr:pyrimidine 5'-nucleotidase [Chloroflexota bacterium]